MTERWLTARAVADALAVRRRLVADLCARGELPARRDGRSWQIRERDFDTWVREQYAQTRRFVAEHPFGRDASAHAWLTGTQARAVIRTRWALEDP